MFDQAKAAEYFIVAWCKDWSIRTLAEVVMGAPIKWYDFSDSDAAAIHERFRWLPPMARFYWMDVHARKYCHDQFPKLSNWLIDRKDNQTRLAASSQVTKLIAKNISPSQKFDRSDTNMAQNNRRHYRQSAASHAMNTANRESNQRGAWSTCKA